MNVCKKGAIIMKIKNRKKFLRLILLVIGSIILVNLFIPENTFSYQQLSKKSVTVCNGDTLWSIAKVEQATNSYYEGKDIRDIVQSIKKTNGLSDANLKANQTLEILTY